MSTKLHVGNIASTILEDDLEAVFTKFGLVENVQIARNSSTGLSMGFATVQMMRDEDAQTAIARLNFTQYGGRTIAVSLSR